jgi:para-aminobenzoate synthetase/4-amino-4-deoxychorismate lyase
LRLGVFDEPIIFNHQTGRFFVKGRRFNPPSAPAPSQKKCVIDRLRLQPDHKQYLKTVEAIRRALRAGESYQTNFTGREEFRFQGDPFALYECLRDSQPTAFNALIRHGDSWIISCSPELFFRIEGTRIRMEPMKGTSGRGRTLTEDRAMKRLLRQSEKNRSENTMIVDLIRSDLGALCRIGSVKTSYVCAMKTLQSVLQMTTDVRGSLRDDVTWTEIFGRLFPCGSVTGAPKLRTMELIAIHETSPRGVYCGAIGFLTQKQSKRQATFSVPIRTATLEGSGTTFRGTLGSGGGILVDSVPEKELEELRLKTGFLTYPIPRFQLIETLLLKQGSFPLLDAHLCRLRTSAEYWRFPMDESAIRTMFHSYAKKYSAKKDRKIRLLLDRTGGITCTASILPRKRITLGAIAFSADRVDSHDPFLFHKTTHRPLYSKARIIADQKGMDDILFCNERGEVTESTIANLIIEKSGRRFTPALTCGLLPGIFRNQLLRERKIREAILRPNDVQNADRIFLCNAVRGMWEVRLGAE